MIVFKWFHWPFAAFAWVFFFSSLRLCFVLVGYRLCWGFCLPALTSVYEGVKKNLLIGSKAIIKAIISVAGQSLLMTRIRKQTFPLCCTCVGHWALDASDGNRDLQDSSVTFPVLLQLLQGTTLQLIVFEKPPAKWQFWHRKHKFCGGVTI